MGEDAVETAIDRLVSYITDMKRVDLRNAAQFLGMAPPQVEKLASLLEDSGLIEINYGLTKTELVSRELEEEEKKVKKAEAKKKSAVVRAIEQLKTEVEEEEKMMEFMEKNISRRINRAKEILGELENAKEVDGKDLGFLNKEFEIISNDIARFNEWLKKLGKEETGLVLEAASFQSKLDELAKKIGAKTEAEKKEAPKAKEETKAKPVKAVAEAREELRAPVAAAKPVERREEKAEEKKKAITVKEEGGKAEAKKKGTAARIVSALRKAFGGKKKVRRKKAGARKARKRMKKRVREKPLQKHKKLAQKRKKRMRGEAREKRLKRRARKRGGRR